MNLITTLLNGTLKASGNSRLTETKANLKLNQILFDIRYTGSKPSDLAGESLEKLKKLHWLKDIMINVTHRVGSAGSASAGAISIFSDCSLYSLLFKSDFEGGFSVAVAQDENKKAVEGTKAVPLRLVGCLDVGFFSMTSSQALDIAVSCASVRMPSDVDLTISAVYFAEKLTTYKYYRSFKPTGGDQQYKNVLTVDYIGEQTVNKNAIISDDNGAQTVNIEDAKALANSVGRFEMFTAFGELYKEPYGVSQDVSIRVPNDDEDAEVLITGLNFNPQLLNDQGVENKANYDALIEKIKLRDADKYDYLVAIGMVSSK